MGKSISTISKLCRRGFSFLMINALAVSMIPSFPAAASANAKESEPALLKAGSLPVNEENYTKGGPFPSGTANSDNFRIPALVTTENGTLVAAADARYDRISADGSAPDGGGLDTIASVSSDGGKTWYYSFPIYFPDSAQNAFTKATTIIDPGLVVGPDNTIYCIADVCPTGVTTMGGFRDPGQGTGYVEVDGEQRLALTTEYTTKARIRPDQDGAGYEYYVGDFEDGYAPVLHMEDGTASAYFVDEWYNLYSDAGNGGLKELKQKQVDSDTDIQQNVFYGDSELHVYETGYLWMVSSKDNGCTWQAPVILNTQIKRSDDENDQALLVSPGKGISTRSGDIVIGFYNWKPRRESASMVYSTDNGVTWQRTEDTATVPGTEIDTSSENEIVELKDGTLRMFFRHGGYRDPVGNLCYVDAQKQTDGSYRLKTPVQTDISIHKGCNLSALSYSREIDGKQVILVSAPSNIRANGQILTLLVNDDEEQSLECIQRTPVPGGQGGYGTFVYSCLSELQDGTVGLLWEPSHKAINYSRFSVDNRGVLTEYPTAVSVEMEKDEVYQQANYDGEKTVTVQPDPDIAAVSFSESAFTALYDHKGSATDSFADAFSDTPNNTIRLSDAEYTFTETAGGKWTIKNDAANLYLTNSHADYGHFFESTASDMDVVSASGKYRISNAGSGRYIVFYKPQTNFNAVSSYDGSNGDLDYGFTLLERDSSSADGIILGYKQAAKLVSGKKYLIAYVDESGKAAILYPETKDINVNNRWYRRTKMVSSSAGDGSVSLMITGIGEGYTEAVIDGITYDIHVTEEHPEPVPGCGHTQTILKNYKDASCETMGYTGDRICESCNAVIEKGTVIPAGHDWDEGIIQKEVTKDTDGFKIYTCKKDSSHQMTEIVYASAYAPFMDVYENAVSRVADAEKYSAIYEGVEVLKTVLAKAEQIAAGKVTSRSKMYEMKDALEQAKAFVKVKPVSSIQADLTKALQTAEADINAAPKDIPAHIWTAFETAYRNAKGKAPEGLSEEEQSRYVYDLLRALQNAQRNLDTAKPAAEQALNQAKKNLADTLEQAKAIYTKGAAGYTEASWKVFLDAYNAALNASDADSQTLNGLSDALKKAQAGLQTAAVPTPQSSDTAVYKKVKYQILNASKKTAAAILCTDKKATSITIPSAVKIAGVNYKVVQINANVFKGASKMASVTIGKYITKIEKNAFSGCKKLRKVTFKGTAVKSIGKNAFKNTASKITVKVPKSLQKGKKRNAFKKKLTGSGMSKNVRI